MNRTNLLFAMLMFMVVACAEDPETTPESNEPTEENNTTTSDVLAMPTTYGTAVDRSALTRDAVIDYGVESGTSEDQTSKLQAALDDLNKWGGGNLIIPEGEYHMYKLCMRSNVHILVSSKAVLKPYYKGYDWQQNINMIEFSYSDTSKDGQDGCELFVENCSISCLEGEGSMYTVDFSSFYSDVENNVNLYSPMFPPSGITYDQLIDQLYVDADGMCFVRFVRGRMVRNFLIADANIIGNYTTCCGMVFVGSDVDESLTSDWEVVCPTNGVVRDCKFTSASHGYGLCQTHAAREILFEDLWCNGGVTLRLEAHNGGHVGLFDIYGHNIYNEYGKAAVLLQPHSTHHGTMTIEGVTSVSSAFGVLIREGFTGSTSSGTANGTFADDCRINNINITYGVNAQIEEKDVWTYDESEYDTICNVRKATTTTVKNNAYIYMYEDFNQFEGASYAPVFDDTDGTYTVTCTNITYNDFPAEIFDKYIKDGVIYSGDLPKASGYIWTAAYDRLSVFKDAILYYND
ncbi:MAG: hypothetical protein SNF68_07190 [Rikenellaceae bacterium]